MLDDDWIYIYKRMYMLCIEWLLACWNDLACELTASTIYMIWITSTTWWLWQVWHDDYDKYDMTWFMYKCDDACSIRHNEGCQLTILSNAFIMELTDGLLNEWVSTNYGLWYTWPTVLWNGSLSMNSDKGTYVGHIMINYEPWPTDLWNGSVL